MTQANIDLALERNRTFAAAGGQEGAVVFPNLRLYVITCLDPRTDPAHFLGLRLGDAIVIRNTGGRVTEAVIDDIAYLTYLAGQLFGEQAFAASGFEVAIIQHTQCGAGFLADPGFRRHAAAATGIPEATLEASAVDDPHATVKADVQRLLASPLLHPAVRVSGHVYDIATGRLTTTMDARHPQPLRR